MKWSALSPLPTHWGTFCVRVLTDGEREHLVLSLGDLNGDAVLTRIHSACLTGEALGSLRCDCAGQLEDAFRRISEEGRGVIVYLQQEGRGIGLTAKIRAYALQARGVDTVDANRYLGLPDDTRDYEAAVEALRHLGVNSVRLLTNNPRKYDALEQAGIQVSRVATLVDNGELAKHYLQTKQERMGHLTHATGETGCRRGAPHEQIKAG